MSTIKVTNIQNPSSGTDDIQIDPNGNVAVDTNTLYVDATNNRVGIGTASPAQKLHVSGSGSIYALVTNTGTGPSNAFLGASNAQIQLIARDATTGAVPTVFINGTTEAMRIDSSGKLLVGTSSARNNFFNELFTPKVQIEDTGSSACVSITTNTTNGGQRPILAFGRANGTSVGSTTPVGNNNRLGSVSFQGSDGTEFVEAATIDAYVDGTPGANNMPGRLSFATTASGASSPTERMQITNIGDFDLSGNGANAGNIYGGFGAKSTSGTLDWNHISNARSGNGTTLLTGTATNGPGGSGYYHSFCFEFSNKDGTGNMTQFAIGYNVNARYMRYRFSNVWTSWVAF